VLDLAESAQRAHDLIQYADGLSRSGDESELPSRIRALAREHLEVIDHLAAVTSALGACKERYESALTIIGKAAYFAAEEAARD
jgi:hypothetical protein